jgi:hypothetical protein
MSRPGWPQQATVTRRCKFMRAHINIVFITLALLVSSCASPPALNPLGSPSGLSGEEQGPPTPFLERPDYSERIGIAVSDVLDRHRFSIPWIVVRGSDKSLWFVAERFQSEHRFDRIQVRVAPEEHPTASIACYQFGPSAWAILGTLFADPRPEAELIGREIAAKLSDNRNITR